MTWAMRIFCGLSLLAMCASLWAQAWPSRPIRLVVAAPAGSSSHLTMEYLKLLTGTYALHIPFNGAPHAMISVVSGDAQALTTVPTVIMPQVKASKMRALAVTGGGLEPAGGTADVFGKLIADEAAKCAPIIKRTGARLD